MRSLLFIMMLFMLGFGLPAAAKDAPPDYLTPYNALLKAHVTTGEKDGIPLAFIDYAGWAADKNHVEAMKQLRLVKLDTLNAKEQEAFWINAYNLLTIDLIVQNKQKETIKNIGSILDDPWKTFSWRIDGKDVRLYEIEHEKLPIHADLRLHMALANGTVTGADLRNDAYMADTLDTQLDEQVKHFLDNKKKGLLVMGTVLEVSPLFKRFAADFELKGGAASFLRKYHSTTPGNGVVEGYFDEDWSLNGDWSN